MKFDLAILQAALGVVAPAIATKSAVDQLTHIWFYGDHIMGFNDVIGISKPFETDFTGGLPGKVLLDLLGVADAKEVEITPKGDHVLVVVGSAEVELPCHSLDQSVFNFKDLAAVKSSFEVSAELRKALNLVMLTLSSKERPMVDQNGITLICDGDTLDLYTTDGVAMSCASVPPPAEFDLERLVLTPLFVEQLLRFCADGGKMSVTGDGALAMNEGGVCLFGRVIDPEDSATDYPQYLSRYLPKGMRDKVVEIPPRLRLALERALVISNKAVPVTLTLDGEKLRIRVEVKGRGKLDDSMALAAPHNKAEIVIYPELIKRALPQVKTIGIARQCLVMTGDQGYVYLAAEVANG